MYICSRRDVITVECLDGINPKLICAFCWFISVFIVIKFVLLKMSKVLLETCLEL